MVVHVGPYEWRILAIDAVAGPSGSPCEALTDWRKQIIYVDRGLPIDQLIEVVGAQLWGVWRWHFRSASCARCDVLVGKFLLTMLKDLGELPDCLTDLSRSSRLPTY